jgi:hypothetical protein
MSHKKGFFINFIIDNINDNFIMCPRVIILTSCFVISAAISDDNAMVMLLGSDIAES